MRWKYHIVVMLLVVSSIYACKQTEGESAVEKDEVYVLQIPAGFSDPVIPEDNALTKSRIKLGKKLFYDPILSVDSTISCSSCHLQEHAFSDNVAFSKGVEDRLGFRNSPSLANVAYQPLLMWDGGVATIELQVFAPIDDHAELDFNMVLACDRLKASETYTKMSQEAYGRNPDSFVLTRALAAFERTLISGNSRYDQYKHQGQKDALTANELSGLELFESHCTGCHSGVNFTDYTFQNNGLYEAYADTGRARITWKYEDRGKFKVPSLRNIEVTAPYMHDGSMATLHDVIDHYINGGSDHPNKSPLIKPFVLSAPEVEDLIAFLKTLTDMTFINNPEFAAE
jgi:cytochrome c peroxidase